MHRSRLGGYGASGFTQRWCALGDDQDRVEFRPRDPTSRGADSAAGADELLGILLRAISHDLKSTPLTLSLNAELMADLLPVGEHAQVARDGLTNGVREMERMLDAVTAISRARTRILAGHPVPLGDILSGHIVLSEEERLG